MADVVVNFLQQQLAQLIEEASFDSGVVEDEVKSFQRELERINIFLDNSDGKRSDHENVKALVRQITEVAYEAEHVIDTFIVEVEEHKKRNFLGKIIYRIGHAKMLRTVAKKIEGLNREINKIYDDIEKYGIERDEVRVDAEVLALHRRRRYVEEDDVVGFRDDCDTLVKQLTFQTQNSKLDVISIIGMGGLGKTTLARKIYNDDRIKSHFHCHVWVYVSQDFKIRELFLEILKSQLSISSLDMLIEELKEKSEEHAKEVLLKKLLIHLQGKKYLVVMDDIWKTQDWNEVKNAFPDDSNGSRILITSRIREVALHASPTFPYILQFLNKDESWELFHKKVFRGERCPPALETLGRQIAEGCRGLPLSIVVLGGLLANKEKTNRTWSKVIADVNWYLTECKDILALSYTHLPRRLKPCFLYFGGYPEDSEIPVRELIKLWIAEGFIHHTGKRNNEDVADDYLEELIDRNLIQMATRRSDEGAKSCRIHDLLRDLCIFESKESKFLELLRDGNLSFPIKSRRLSVHVDRSFPLYIFPDFSDPPCARSLFFFGDEEVTDWNLFVENFKLIRVLNFECIQLHSFPKSIGTTIHLRYLRIHLSTTVRVIPDSIRNLMNLETLFIEGSLFGIGVYSVTGIFKLQRLRNLYLKGILPLPYHLDEALWNLQVLSTATLCCDEEENFPVALDKFPCVRELRIQFICMRRNFESESKAVDYLEGLHRLRYLQILRIEQFPMLPNDLSSFPLTITQLTLHNVQLRVGGGMTVLGNLPNLRILKIKWCSDIIDLHIFGDSFPRLEVLKLRSLKQVKEWKQEGGAMPCLKYLVIGGCYCLTMLPPELWSLTALQKVEVFHPNSRLAQMLQELQMMVSCELVISSGDYNPRPSSSY